VISPQLNLKLNPDEGLLVDLFAGGGGASTGTEKAFGRNVDIAINHNAEAIAMHRMNHPQTKHYTESVFVIDPKTATKGKRVRHLHASPDCTHFSNAAADTPKDKKIRGLAWSVIHWVDETAPEIITLENVVEFTTWGPLIRNEAFLNKLQRLYPKKKLKINRPNPARSGWFFKCFVGALRRRGYSVDWKPLRACEFGVPTTRKRLFLVARRDGKPIQWPKQTHFSPKVAKSKSARYREAWECIDFSIPCPSIFDRPKPYAEASNNRIAKGTVDFVLNNPDPFIVPNSNLQIDFITENANSSSARCWSAKEPLRTQVSSVKGGHFARCSVFLTRYFGQSIGQDVMQPFPTVMPGGMGKTGLVSAFICKMRNGNIGHDMREPLHTISAGGNHHAACYAFLTKYYGTGNGSISLKEPLHTITSKDRFGLVVVKIHGELWALCDIGYRMLQPHELYRAMGFPKDYIIDRGLFIDENTGRYAEKKFTKVAQVRMCGNSVPPDMIECILKANIEAPKELEVAT